MADKLDGNPTRGIPTAEIIGSSVKKLPRSESKSETTKKISKLPRMSPKTIQEPRADSTELGNASSISSDVLESTNQPQPRRNSLERPSYYNSLYKTGVRAYNGSMARSLNLVADSHNGDASSDSSVSANIEHLNKFDRYLTPSRVDNGESSASEYDYLSVRPYSTLGRTFSLKSPTGKSYDYGKTPKKPVLDSEIEGKYGRNQTTNIARVSNLKGSSGYSSRFIRPQSLYGTTDFTNYQGLQTTTAADTGKANIDLLTDRKSAFVRRRSPSYQRSISLFEGKKPDDFQRSSSVTPDRSVLGKFLSDKKSEKNDEVLSRSEKDEKPKVRKVSRFLRPDFYDTPKEDSVYEKKEKVKNVSHGEIWKEKDKTPTARQKKSKKHDEAKNQENRLSIVDKAIKSLKENSVSKIDHESMARESNLIKRAVSLEDCSIVPENRSRRSNSLTPQSNYDSKISTKKFEKMFQKKKVEDFKKIVDQKLNSKSKDLNLESGVSQKQESVIKKIVRKISPRSTKQKSMKSEDQISCNGTLSALEKSLLEDSVLTSQDSRSRLSRIAGLKRLEFTRPVASADSTPSMEDKMSADCDDSSSFLSPTEDGSDTWSISSDYADAREFITTPTNAEDSVSDRIRRKSFYSRFNQSKRRKSSQSSQLSGSRSRLPMYSKSMTSDFSSVSKPTRKISDPDMPTEN